MAFSVQMPALGESVTEGTVTRWLKQEGDRVEVDEPLVEISTDKVDTEIPSPAAGILQRIVAREDETVAVGAELAVIADESEIGGSGTGPTTDQAQRTDAAEPAAPAPAASPADSAPATPAEPPAQRPAPGGGGATGTPVLMPALGESVTEGTVTRWLKQVGDRVEVDEPLVEISTDKVDTEIPSPAAGTLLEITAGEDQVVQVGGQLGVIGDPAAAPAPPAPAGPAPTTSAPAPPAQRAEPAEPPSQEGAPPMPPAPRPAPRIVTPAAPPAEQPATPQPAAAEPSPQGAPYITPLVRKLAAEYGVDLSTVKGSGVGGRIRKQDVLAAAEAQRAAAKRAAAEAASAPATAPAAPTPAEPAPAKPSTPARVEGPQPGTTAKMSRLRQLIATRMRESLQVSAQLTTVQEVDVTRIARLRDRAKADFERREGVKLTFLPFFARATVETLKQFPQFNASINEETQEVTYHEAVHLGIAVDTPRGLVVPVIRNAEDLTVAGLAKRIADIAERTRSGRIGPDELSGGTFTITNIGSAGALFDTPIINQPQVAILGTGAIRKEPKVVTGPDGEDAIAIRSVCFLPLTYDHRLIDGADAGRFLSAVRARLEEGAFEADLGL